jgi:chromosome segregation ATPase
LKQKLSRKEKEMMHMSAKVEDEQALIIKFQNQIKELGGRVEELEEEAENERQSRIKCEKQRAHMSQELEELSEKLRDAGESTSVQSEMNNRKDLEIHKLRREIDEEHQQKEAHLEAVKNKHIQTSTETTEQLEKQIKTNQSYLTYFNNCQNYCI